MVIGAAVVGGVVGNVLQAAMPSAHVCAVADPLRFIRPHCRNQAPPRAQQLRFPDRVKVEHLGHMGLTRLAMSGFAVDLRRSANVRGDGGTDSERAG